MNWNTLRNLVSSAIARTVVRDQVLFKIDAHELSVSHRLAVYLEEILRDGPLHSDGYPFNVDCEYDCAGDHAKTLSRADDPEFYEMLFECRKRAQDKGYVGVCPDIIVHRRRGFRLGDNLLVIELKTGRTQVNDCDLIKLRGFTSEDVFEFQYEYGLLLKFRSGPNFQPAKALQKVVKYHKGVGVNATDEFSKLLQEELLKNVDP